MEKVEGATFPAHTVGMSRKRYADMDDEEKKAVDAIIAHPGEEINSSDATAKKKAKKHKAAGGVGTKRKSAQPSSPPPKKKKGNGGERSLSLPPFQCVHDGCTRKIVLGADEGSICFGCGKGCCDACLWIAGSYVDIGADTYECEDCQKKKK